MKQANDTIPNGEGRVSFSYLGPAKSYAHIAAVQYFGTDAEEVDGDTFEVCRNVSRGITQFGVLPIENNSTGFIDLTLDALYETSNVYICDEIFLPVHHQLLSKATSLDQIERIYSHQAAFAACRRTIERLERRNGRRFGKISVQSTSLGADHARSEPKAAAIAAAEAAGLYELNTVVSNIHDRRDNTTRFWVLSSGRTAKSETPEPARYRTTFLVELEHRIGTLRALLSLFADRGCNLLWLHTRPIRARPSSVGWEYAFFLEYEGRVEDDVMDGLYRLLKGRRIPSQTRSARLLGSYPNRLPA